MRLLTILLLAALPAYVAAQQPLAVGDRIRIHGSRRPLTGKIRRLTDSTIEIRAGRRDTAVARHGLTIDRADGTSAMPVGAAFAVVSAAAASLLVLDYSGCNSGETCIQAIATTAPIGGTVGFLLGAFIGSFDTRWVPAPSSPRVSIRPIRGGGAALHFRVQFGQD